MIYGVPHAVGLERMIDFMTEGCAVVGNVDVLGWDVHVVGQDILEKHGRHLKIAVDDVTNLKNIQNVTFLKRACWVQN
jgi:hypothetical protein